MCKGDCYYQCTCVDQIAQKNPAVIVVCTIPTPDAYDVYNVGECSRGSYQLDKTWKV